MVFAYICLLWVKSQASFFITFIYELYVNTEHWHWALSLFLPWKPDGFWSCINLCFWLEAWIESTSYLSWAKKNAFLIGYSRLDHYASSVIYVFSACRAHCVGECLGETGMRVLLVDVDERLCIMNEWRSLYFALLKVSFPLCFSGRSAFFPLSSVWNSSCWTSLQSWQILL